MRSMVGTLIGLILLLLLCVMQWPSILINEHTLSLAAHYAQKRSKTAQVKWDQARVSVHHRGLFSNQLVFDFQDLCFQDPSYGHGCFEHLSAAMAYGFRHALPGLTELGPIQARAREITVQIPEQKAATTKPSRPMHLPALVADAKLEPMDVKVEHWTFTLPNLQLAGSYMLAGSTTLTSKIDMSVKSHALGGALNSHAQITAQAQTLSDRLRGPWKAQTDLDARSTDGKSRLSNHSTIGPGQKDRFDFEINNHSFSPLGTSNIRVTGWALPGQETRGEIRGKLEPARAQRNSPLSLLSLLQMNRLQLEGCHFDLISPDQKKQDGKFTAGCFLDSQIVRFRLYGQEQPPIKLWRKLGVLLTADVALPAPAHSSTPVSGELTLKPQSDESSPLQLGGQVTTHFEVMPGEAPVPRQLGIAIDLSLSIPLFQKLARALTDTPIAIPAPLRPLDGPTSARIRGDLTLNQGGKLALDLGTHLNHAPDHLNVTGNGDAAIESLKTLFEKPPRIPQVDAGMDIALSDIHLTLPKTGISIPPDQVLPDARIHTNVPNASTTVKQKTQHGELAGIHYLIRVATPKNHPIEIASELMKKPVAVELDLRLRQGQPWMGFASINDHKEPVGIPSSEMAGEAAESRTGPKPPFGFSELISSLLTGAPFEWVSTQPQTGTETLPKKEESRIGSVIEFRRRY